MELQPANPITVTGTSSGGVRVTRIDPDVLALRIRQHAVRMTNRGRSSHVGSVLGMADILGSLYGTVLRIDPTDSRWAARDRFILSKGHAGAGVYAALAECGFIDTALLDQHCADGSPLSGHVSHKGIPGVEFSTGSLGHGLGVAAGMALAGRLRGSDHRVFCVMSDGECDEGSVWEAILFAGHHRLGNLVAVVDYNKLQSLALVSETLGLEPFTSKWDAFGWRVVEANGHDTTQLVEALDIDRVAEGRPTVVIAHTTKGKGVSFMEDSVLWHYRTPQGDEFDAAMAELEAP